MTEDDLMSMFTRTLVGRGQLRLDEVHVPNVVHAFTVWCESHDVFPSADLLYAPTVGGWRVLHAKLEPHSWIRIACKPHLPAAPELPFGWRPSDSIETADTWTVHP